MMNQDVKKIYWSSLKNPIFREGGGGFTKKAKYREVA